MVDELYLANAVLELASGIVALLVSYTAFRYNRLLRSDILGFLSFGFMLLGVGLLAEGSLHSLISFNIGQILADRALVYVASVIYLILQVIAYSSFLIGYYRSSFGRFGVDTFVPMLSFIVVHTNRNPLLLGTYVNATVQLIVVILLAFVVFQGLLAQSGAKGRSLLVLIGFLLILVAHVVILASSLIISPPLFLTGALVQFTGFLFLLFYILRSGRVVPAAANP
jgi:hypothetical protein